MRRIYTFLLYLMVPLVLLYLWYRGLRETGYRQRWRERFGWIPCRPEKGCIWIHAVSMGEVNAAAGLIQGLVRTCEGRSVLVSTFTPTGSDRVRRLFGQSVFHAFSPLDLPGSVSRFLDRTQPRIAIVMETEIWPNLYHQIRARRIPILMANARISDRSLGRYLRFRQLSKEALGQVDFIAAQSERDAARLVEIGAEPGRVEITGNLKFDLEIDPGHSERGLEWRKRWGADRPVLVAGSTHAREEEQLLEAFNGLLEHEPRALLVLVPRHPERFDRAAEAARAAGLAVERHSDPRKKPDQAECYLVDRMGELMDFYAAGDVVFVGGSLEPVGGHNVLEPAVLGKPVIVGPHMNNFADITGQLRQAGALMQVTDSTELMKALRYLFDDRDERLAMGVRARAQVRRGQGAVNRTLDIIGELLSEAVGSQPPDLPR